MDKPKKMEYDSCDLESLGYNQACDDWEKYHSDICKIYTDYWVKQKKHWNEVVEYEVLFNVFRDIFRDRRV